MSSQARVSENQVKKEGYLAGLFQVPFGQRPAEPFTIIVMPLGDAGPCASDIAKGSEVRMTFQGDLKL